MEADERLSAVVEHRSRNGYAVDRVGAIEDDEALAVLGRGQHRIPHRRDVGVKARSDVLDVEDERVEPLEHRGGWPAMFAVQADDRDAGRGVEAVVDNGDVELAARAVLRAEEPDEFDVSGSMQVAGCAAPVARQARMIGDQSDALSGQRRKAVACQHIDAGEHVGRAGTGQREKRTGKEERTTNHGRDTVEQCMRT